MGFLFAFLYLRTEDVKNGLIVLLNDAFVFYRYLKRTTLVV